MLEFQEKFKKGLKEAVVILVVGCLGAFAVNALRPNGLTLLPERGGHAQDRQVILKARVLSADQCMRMLESGTAVFLDAREDALFKMGHLPGALYVPKDLIDSNIARLKDWEKKGKLLVAYCDGQGCGKAGELAYLLQERGIKSIALFSDGWQGWMDKGYPIDEGVEGRDAGGTFKN
jgi:rhodanese-related sulfurtransferase